MTTRAGKELRIFFIAMILCFMVGAYAVYNSNHQAYVACKRVQNLQNYAILTINRAEKTLPTIAYYKNPDHKAELKQQLRFSEQYKKGFPPVSCTTNIFTGG